LARDDGTHALLLEVAKPDTVSGSGDRKMVNPLKILQVIEPAPVADVARLSATVTSEALRGNAEIRIEMVAAPRGETLLSRSIVIRAGSPAGTRESVRCFIPGGTAKMIVSVELVGTGRILIDDLSVTHAPAAPFAENPNALRNAGFEEGLEGWQMVGGEVGADFHAAKEAARSGSLGCRLRVQGSDRRRRLPNIGQEVITGDLSGREILIDGWLRPEALEGKGYLAAFFYGMGEKGPYQRFVRFDDQFVSGTGPFRHLSKRIAVRGPTIYGVVVRAVLEGEGSLDVDDLALTLVTPAKTDHRGAIIGSSLLVLLFFIAAAIIGRRRRAMMGAP